jgi:mercuric ion binding protein
MTNDKFILMHRSKMKQSFVLQSAAADGSLVLTYLKKTMNSIENCRKAPNPQITVGLKLPQSSNFKSLLMIIFVLMMHHGAQAQEKQQKFQTAVIMTSSECGDCKERIEGALNYTKGVVFAELDVATKQVTVKFSTKKITLQQVKEAIAAIGYDADDVKAIPAAQKKLPACCQPSGMKNM